MEQQRIWSKPGLPHKGWDYIDCVDLKEAIHQCEMCDQEEIRYVHYVFHPEANKTIAVGCVCAEKLVSDYVDAKSRQREVQNRGKRRNSWIQKGWKLTSNGNFMKKNVLVFRRGEGWKVKIDEIWGNKIFPNVDEAKAVAYDYLNSKKD